MQAVSACAPNPVGETCGAGGPASQGDTSGTNRGVGDPIDVITGNLYQREEDLPALPGTLGLEIVRHYNSADRTLGQIGYGWRLSYETELYASRHSIQIVQADGHRVTFLRDRKDPLQCAAANPVQGKLKIRLNASRREEYVWTWTNGRRLAFDSRGKLHSIMAPTGEFLTIQRGPNGEIVQVTDPQGRRLVMQHAGPRASGFKGIVAIESPVGRFVYQHNNDRRSPGISNLESVSYPDGSRRRYHYESDKQSGHPHALTGVSVEGRDIDGSTVVRRVATWAHNAQGKAVLSVRGEPRAAGKPDSGIEQVSIEYRKPATPNGEPGKTIVTNSLGGKTEYVHGIVGSEYRLLEVRGTGCGSCGETNVRYGYNAFAQMTHRTKLNARGFPLYAYRTRYDERGRIVRVTRQNYRDGKPGAEALVQRFEYTGESHRPSVVARPSVVLGEEHRFEVRYDTISATPYLPTAITERGYSPSLGPETPAQPIVRQTGFRYDRRGLLVAVDGPLPNEVADPMPVNSDVTHIDWNAQTRLPDRLTTPGGFVHRIVERDAALRPTVVETSDGVRTVETRLQYTFRGDVTRLEQRAWFDANPPADRSGLERQAIAYRYDPSGNLAEIGEERGGTYRPRWRAGYDVARRNVWVAHALGMLERFEFDSEHRLLAVRAESATQRWIRRYVYDDYGRPVEWTGPSGAITRVRYDDAGRVVLAVDPLGRAAAYRYDDTGQLIAVRHAANTALAREIRFSRDGHGALTRVIAPNGAMTEYWRDDFGRVVAERSADSGTIINQYDEADRLVRQLRASAANNYRYDVAGRLLEVTITGAAPRSAASPPPARTIRYRYVGSRLGAVLDPEQSETYEYDARGRLIRKTTEIAAGESRLTYVTRYRYDPASGRLAGQTLPDGTELRYRANGQGQIIAVERKATPWLSAEPLVTDLQRDLAGLRHYVLGNGVAVDYQRSREGMLARIVHRFPAPRAQPPLALSPDRWSGLWGIADARAEEGGAASADGSSSPAPGAFGLPADPGALLDHRYLYDGAGNILRWRRDRTLQRYLYDPHDRLLQAVHGTSDQFSPTDGRATLAAAGGVDPAPLVSEHLLWRYLYDGAGNRLLAQERARDFSQTAGTERLAYRRAANRLVRRHDDGAGAGVDSDVNGRVMAIGSRRFHWSARDELIAIEEGARTVATYRYNHRGERIAKAMGGDVTYYLYEGRRLIAELDPRGHIRRQYVYLAGEPLALIDTPEGKPLAGGNEDGWRVQWRALRAAAARRLDASAERIYYLHLNHLGAPEAVTDEKAHVVWRTAYAPFGQMMRARAQARPGFTLNLRFPGQYHDHETGLYYNYRRYYDPAQGRYVSPDPLGLRGGINAYAYAANNPLRYIDPLGLVLFAFDGTGNDESRLELITNVVRFRDLYRDGEAYYITGPGTRDPGTGIEHPLLLGGNMADKVWSFTGPARIAAMISRLNIEADAWDDETIMDIDIIGFSRGAAQARDFANQIVTNYRSGYYEYFDENRRKQCQRVNFRFMGLWDTVLSTHTGNYQLAIPDNFRYVAHAVALNEYRGNTISFPLESIMGTPVPEDQTRLERGFLGAHSDIGGGYREGDLARVALVWMVDQATAAGVNMRLLTATDRTIIANPVLHDASSNLLQGPQPSATSEDREVRYRDGTTTTQRRATTFGMTYADTERFITYRENPNTLDDIAGTVDAAAYLNWLNRNGYNLNLAVP